MTVRAAWKSTRIGVLDAQQGRCATDCSSPARDVVNVNGTLIAFCRSCRLRFDAPARAAKARITRLAKQETPEQLTIAGT